MKSLPNHVQKGTFNVNEICMQSTHSKVADSKMTHNAFRSAGKAVIANRLLKEVGGTSPPAKT